MKISIYIFLTLQNQEMNILSNTKNAIQIACQEKTMVIDILLCSYV